MKRKLFLLSAAIVGALNFSAPRASAQITDITVNNGYGSYSAITDTLVTNPDPRPGVDTLSEVDNGNSTSKNWDLEAFGYNPTSSSLTYVAGFNPIGEVDPDTNITYGLGDIFLSSKSIDSGYGVPNLPLSGTLNIPVTPLDYNNPGYNYVVHWTNITSTQLTYSIYALTDQAQVLTPNFAENRTAGAYRLDVSNSPDGSLTLVGTGSAAITTETNAQVNSLLNEQLFTGAAKNDAAADNFIASFDLSQLNLSGFNAHLTEACGNDLLAGSFDPNVSSTPEPHSFALGLMAWLGFMVLIARHRARNP
jgi:hypothetical protein